MSTKSRTFPLGGEKIHVLVEATSLGKWPILPASFAVDAAGEMVVVDYSGSVFRLRGSGGG